MQAKYLNFEVWIHFSYITYTEHLRWISNPLKDNSELPQNTSELSLQKSVKNKSTETGIFLIFPDRKYIRTELLRR